MRHPEQADRWTWLVLAAYIQLCLARALVADRRLPWERRYLPGRLTPNRVRRAVPARPPALGTPAAAPQPCGRSPAPQRVPLRLRATPSDHQEGRLRLPSAPYPATVPVAATRVVNRAANHKVSGVGTSMESADKRDSPTCPVSPLLPADRDRCTTARGTVIRWQRKPQTRRIPAIQIDVVFKASNDLQRSLIA